jgi:hypothetical protein
VPTAEQFDEAAGLFDAAVEEVAGVLGPIAEFSLDDVLRGGTLRGTVEAALAVSSANALAAAGQLHAAAEEARLRAEECRQYATAMTNYIAEYNTYERRLMNPELSTEARRELRPPEQPEKPYDWIDL